MVKSPLLQTLQSSSASNFRTEKTKPMCFFSRPIDKKYNVIVLYALSLLALNIHLTMPLIVATAMLSQCFQLNGYIIMLFYIFNKNV